MNEYKKTAVAGKKLSRTEMQAILGGGRDGLQSGWVCLQNDGGLVCLSGERDCEYCDGSCVGGVGCEPG